MLNFTKFPENRSSLKLSIFILTTALVACASPLSQSTTTVTSPTVIVASTDLAVGPNRFVFAILDKESNPIRIPKVKATFVYLDAPLAESNSHAIAEFVQWPGGRAGVYVAKVSFDLPGKWGVLVGTISNPETDQVAQSGFFVNPISSSPNIGSAPPPTRNKTVRDVSALEEISSSPNPDPTLYQLTIAEALASKKPSVLTIASPTFCRTATCGPQVAVVVSLKNRYKPQANFLHIEVYDNPTEMRGDLTKGHLSPIMQDWGIGTEPFTFVLGRDGLVHSKFEGFVTESELEEALITVLSQ